MKILFYCPTLNYRGTTNAILNYAYFNQTLLGNTSVLAYDASASYIQDLGSEDKVLRDVSSRFPVIAVDGLSGVSAVSDNYDIVYIICSGRLSGEIPRMPRTAIHAVFGELEPHGTRYAFVSEWLSQRYSGSLVPFVPHVVELPEQRISIRRQLGISDDQVMVGRIGGYSTFDLEFVRQAITEVLTVSNDFVFAFVNTPVFIKHPNVKYIAPFFSEQLKSDFICSCDMLVHARLQGESFGLAICESLYHNRPVVAWAGGKDQAHCELLGPLGLLYYSKDDFKRQLFSLAGKNMELRQITDCP